MKPRILCLHGMGQSGSLFYSKIGGARRKLARRYDLDFLDGPLRVDQGDDFVQSDGHNEEAPPPARAWWVRDQEGKHVQPELAFDYVRDYVQQQDQPFDAILGFSQGGLLAVGLALSGDVPGVKAIVTAGAPFVDETFQVSVQRNEGAFVTEGKCIPKLHFAGENDAIIAVERVQHLSDEGGNGQLLLHEKGHLFPTKANLVNAMMDFLEQHVGSSEP